ncbi:MAG: cyclodeaminase/cyclohydrolase family protein, partial [Bacteroidales bacterium]|nr:cyclodeaminase/cyclohydrolase family protein [Bacteroidales bacterium]
DVLKPFKPEEKIIEYMIEGDQGNKLIDMNLREFSNETASESPAPGGGSISAYVGALGVSLGTMVANLSSHKRGWDDYWEKYSDWAEKGQQYKDELLFLVDEDTRAFNNIMNAFRLPKKTKEEKKARQEAVENASKYAMEIPFRVMKAAYGSMEVMKAMAGEGNPNSVSDAGVGALCATTAVRGAYMNVRINASGIEDKDFVNDLIEQGKEIQQKAIDFEKEIVAIVDKKIKESE